MLCYTSVSQLNIFTKYNKKIVDSYESTIFHFINDVLQQFLLTCRDVHVSSKA